MAAVRESSPLMAEVMEKTEMSDVVITADNVLKSNLDYQSALDNQHILHARLVSLMPGVSFTIVESSGGEGIEAWRLFSEKYNPRTHSRCVQLVLGITDHKIARLEDVLASVVRWEAQVAFLARDHKETLSETQDGILAQDFAGGLTRKGRGTSGPIVHLS